MPKKFTVIVAGAGPGGCVAARNLALSGIEVTLIEKGDYENLGHDWSDAVERAGLEKAGFDLPPADSVNRGALVKAGKEGSTGIKIFEEHAYPEMDVWAPDYSEKKRIFFKYITTDRRALGKLLADEAEEAGAEILYGHEVTGIEYSGDPERPGGFTLTGVKVRGPSGETELLADIVIDGTGHPSAVRTLLPDSSGLNAPFPDEDFADVYRTVRKKSDTEEADLTDHYRYGYLTGYQWFQYLNAEEVDVGAGVRRGGGIPEPKEIVEEFIGRHPSISGKTLGGGGGRCLVGKSPFTLVAGGFLAVGDAAAQVIPMTGCGAGAAMEGGTLAAEVIVQAAEKNRKDIECLWEYNWKWFVGTRRGMYYAALTSLRKSLQVLSHEEISYLFRRDILSASLLTDSINGIYTPPPAKTKLRTLIRGFSRPGLLLKLNRAIGRASRIYRHYADYPREWDPDRFARWKEKAETLFRGL